MNENEIYEAETPEVLPAPEVPAEDVSDASEAPGLDTSEGSEDASMDDTAFGSGPSAVETVYVAVPEERPFMTTSFEDYTVTEGLLLLVFLLLVVKSVFNLVGRWF